MRQGATFVLGLLLLCACGSRTDLWSNGGIIGATPTGKGGNAGTGNGTGFGSGTGGTTGTGGAGTGTGGIGGGGTAGTTGSGGVGTGGTGTGGATGGVGGTGTGGATGGVGGTGTGGATGGVGGTGTGGATGGVGGTGTGGATGGVGGTGTGGVGGSPPDAGAMCFELLQSAFASLDFYFLVDKSESMAIADPPDGLPNSRYERAKSAIHAFWSFEGLPMRAGIGFFPFQTSAGAGVSCAPADYVTPNVEIRHPDRDSVLSIAMAAQTLRGQSSTGPALEGALTHLLQWVKTKPPDDPRRAVAYAPPSVILVTDGPPTLCGGGTIDSTVAAAAAAFDAAPHIRTYVLGIGADAKGLEPIAKAGGTDRVYASRPLDINDALDRIRRTRNLCDIPLRNLPASDIAALQVRSRLLETEPLVPLPRVGGLQDCSSGSGGWFLEPPDKPTMGMVCPATCAAIVDAPAGRILPGFARCSNAAGSEVR